MRVLLMTLGTRGDVQPFVTLARGLNAAGHEAVVASSAALGWLAEEQGVAFAPLDLDFTELQNSAAGAAVMRGEVRAVAAAMRQVRPLYAASLRDQQRVVAECQPDVLLTHPKTLGGRHLAEWKGIPHADALVVPGFTRTRAFPPIPLTWTGTPAWLNRLAYAAVPAATSSFTGVITSWREEVGLPGKARVWDGGVRTLYGYSPSVVPDPADYPATARAVGYWLPEPPETYDDDPALVEFIESGEPPVYVGFGSMTDEDPRALGALIADAVARSGRRAVVQSGQGLIEAEGSASLYVASGVPHGWLFPRMACLVHHGGSGTTGEAIRARRPQVVVPFAVDQPFWAKRMQLHGVAPAPLPRKALTAESLAAAITRAVGDRSMAAAASRLGDAVWAEDGIAGAIDYLESLTATRR